jgi:hypothetical protein
VLISTITIEPMAYMKKPSKKMYGGNKKTGSFLEPNKELSFGGVKTMATGGGRPNESPVDSAAAARRGAENAAKKKAEAQRLARAEARRQRTKNAEQSNARQRTARDGSTMDKIGVMGTGATRPKPQDVGAERAGASKATLDARAEGVAAQKANDAKKAAAAGPKAGTYAYAKKRNPNLDKLIKERKGLTKGTVEYNRVQNQINKAYDKGPMRTEINKIAPKPATKNPERNPTIKSSTPAKPAAKPAAKKPVAKVSTKPTASRTGMSPQGDTRALQAELKSAAPAASAKKPIDRRNARSARKTDRLKKRVGRLQSKMQAGGKR